MDLREGTLAVNLDVGFSLPKSFPLVLVIEKAHDDEFNVMLPKGIIVNCVEAQTLLPIAEGCTFEFLQAVSAVPNLPKILQQLAQEIRKLQENKDAALFPVDP
jgi:hypothetical protein